MSRPRSRLAGHRAGAWLSLWSCLACGPAGDEPECPAWTRPIDGRCTLRSWDLPSVDDALGEPGARDVQVAVGPEDQTLLAWTRATMADGYVVVAESRGEGWSTRDVRMDEGIGLEPAVALGPDGEALLTWKQQLPEGAVYLAPRDPAGTWRWPAIDEASSWSETAYEPRVRFGPTGEALVVWNQWTGENFGVAVGTRPPGDPHGPFTTPRDTTELLSPAVNFANAPRIAVGSDAEVLITWYQAPLDDLMVYVSERRPPEQRFSRPGASAFLSLPEGPVDSHAQANPRPALHPSGSAAVAWTQQLDADSILVFVATRDPDGTWHPPSSVDDALSPPGALARCPQLAFDPHGDLVVTWFQTLGDDTGVFAWRGPVGDASIEPQRLSSPGATAVHASLGVDADGGALVVWAEQTGESWSVIARRHGAQTGRWFPPEPLSSAVEGLAPEPRVAVDPDSGRAVVAWAQGAVTEGRVFVATLP